MKFRTVLFRIGTLGAAALILIVNAQKMPAQVADSEEISKLLIEAKSHAVLAENDAESLESFTYSQRSWQQHGYKLAAIRVHVNDLGKVSKHLLTCGPRDLHGSRQQSTRLIHSSERWQGSLPLRWITCGKTNLWSTCRHIAIMRTGVMNSPSRPQV